MATKTGGDGLVGAGGGERRRLFVEARQRER